MENKENAKVTKRGTVFYNELNISLMKNYFVYAVNFSKNAFGVDWALLYYLLKPQGLMTQRKGLKSFVFVW